MVAAAWAKSKPSTELADEEAPELEDATAEGEEEEPAECDDVEDIE